jgi:hypothetical protein
MNKTIFQSPEQSAEAKKIELTARALQQRKDN